MIKNIKQRLGRDEEQGFTLIELMVVVLIIAILMAIAIPTFLSSKNTANARATQSNIRNAITAEATVYTDGQAFTNSTTTLSAAEPALKWQDAALATLKQGGSYLAVETDTTASTPNQNLFVFGYGSDGYCYIAWDNAGTVVYNMGAEVGGATPTPPAKGACAAPSSTESWYPSWTDAKNQTNVSATGSIPAALA